MKTEIQLQLPIPDQMLQVDFLNKWVDANHVLDLELHEAAMEKTDRHGATDVGTLWAVVQTFQKSDQPLPWGWCCGDQASRLPGRPGELAL